METLNELVGENNLKEVLKTKKKKGESTTAVAIQRLREPQLNLVFGALKYEEIKRIKISLDTALKNKKDEERKALQKKIDELDKD
jgi:hypothetical protein